MYLHVHITPHTSLMSPPSPSGGGGWPGGWSPWHTNWKWAQENDTDNQQWRTDTPSPGCKEWPWSVCSNTLSVCIQYVLYYYLMMVDGNLVAAIPWLKHLCVHVCATRMCMCTCTCTYVQHTHVHVYMYVCATCPCACTMYMCTYLICISFLLSRNVPHLQFSNWCIHT